VKITVILCTYNRCQRLSKALQSVATSRLSESVAWEVLVVDNNSSDRTPDVVKEFAGRYSGRFRYLFEPQPGKSYALNAGIRDAAGEILAFMDDDVVVEATWLENLTKPFRDGDWMGTGGRILPDWTREPPRWLQLVGRYALAPLAVFDLGPTAGQLDEPPFGTNMAFRKGMFAKYGGFRTDLGPHPTSQIRSEDTEFGRRLLAGGERLWYEPSAVVYHPVAEERLEKKYFLAWWFDKGRADIREFGISPDATYYVARVPLYMFRNLASGLIRWSVALEPRLRFLRKAEIWQGVGQIAECWRRTPDTNSVTELPRC
jgi:glycosyltransferase involved in cell wall biosynthesis